MNKFFSFPRFLLLFCSFILVTITTVSCKNEPDAKEAAEDQNEEVITNDAKEDDAEFLVDAAALDLKEIELGKLAAKSANAEVASHGKMMTDAHTTSFNEVKMLAEQKQIVVPMSIATDQIDEYKDLNDKTGADFDKKYLDIMVDKHEKAVNEYEEYIRESQDAEIKSWAEKNLATLRGHLDHTKQLHEKLK
ncbi:MAG: DUF4142 domain-containing protein [Flavobacterium sp.]|nr:DUF4142 domain-containing protein [Flavobacterium sp.]